MHALDIRGPPPEQVPRNVIDKGFIFPVSSLMLSRLASSGQQALSEFGVFHQNLRLRLLLYSRHRRYVGVQIMIRVALLSRSHLECFTSSKIMDSSSETRYLSTLTEYNIAHLKHHRASLVQKVEGYLDDISLFITRCVISNLDDALST